VIKKLIALALCFGLTCVVGCTSKPTSSTTTTPGTTGTPPRPRGEGNAMPNPNENMRRLAVYLQQYGKDGRLPAKLDDLTDLKRDLPLVYQAIQDGACVVSWGAPYEAEDIVAYERDAPSKGGVVLTGDGGTRRVSAEEFRTARKAKAAEGSLGK
jgi:hypothetical protein